MKVVSFVLSLGVMTAGCEWWQDRGNGWDVGKQISDDVSLDAEF